MPPGNPWDRDCSGSWCVVWQSYGGKGSGGRQEQDDKPKQGPERRTMLAFIKKHKAEWEDFRRAGRTKGRGEPAYVQVAWTCHVCYAQHHNLKKRTCRVCLAPRDVGTYA